MPAPAEVPAHSIEAEQSVLGALMIDTGAWARTATKLAAADFSRADHRLIFDAIQQLAGERRAADVITVGDLLTRRGEIETAGGLAYLSQIVRHTPTAAHIETYAGVVRDRALLRRLRALGAKMESDTRSSAAELFAGTMRELLELQRGGGSGRGLVASRDLAGELIDDLDARCERRRGLEVGLADFDALTYGLEAGDLVVIAARPGMGKTSLLMSIAGHVAASHPVAVFSAEMPARQLMRRAVALFSAIPQQKLRRADQLTDDDWREISRGSAAVSQRQLYIDDTPLPRLDQVRAESMRLKARSGLGLVMVDYVQLVRGDGHNRYEQLRDVAYGFKALAKELAVPVILLAQLNRGVESREQKRPHLSDLRDSGAIEEAADVVGLLYSEGYYRSDFGMAYVLECAIAKNRNGERGECLWRFNGAHSRVEILDDGAQAQYRRMRAEAQRGSAGNDNDL